MFDFVVPTEPTQHQYSRELLKESLTHSLLLLSEHYHVELRVVTSLQDAASKVDSVLGGAASAPYAITLLQQLRGLFLAMARREGSTALEAAQVQTLFSMAGSTILSRQAYGTLLSLPCRLPFDRAQDLVRRLVEAVTAVRATDEGARQPKEELRSEFLKRKGGVGARNMVRMVRAAQ